MRCWTFALVAEAAYYTLKNWLKRRSDDGDHRAC